MGFSTGALVVVPVPAEDEVPATEIKDVIDEALEAARAKASPVAASPLFCSQDRGEDRRARAPANVALLKNNAKIAGEIAVALRQ